VRENRMHGSTGGGWKRDPQGYRASRLPNRHRTASAGTHRRSASVATTAHFA